MSLFQTEEFWTTKHGQGESYTSSTLCVSNFFSSSSTYDQIVTGSLNGYLRLFSPQKDIDSKSNSDVDSNPFSISKPSSSIDISIEHYLSQPILQIESGKFSNDSKPSLAILNPNKLLILEVDEENMVFKTVEEFNLKRVAYNFCFGNFGQVSDRDFICVQSTDTTLSFYVNGHLSFICFLEDYLIPGPIQYLPADDSILIVNSNRYFESYKYKNIAVLNSQTSESASGKSQKYATADWQYNLGEDAIQIETHESRDSNTETTTILILCRFSIFIFDYRNRLAQKKRFECRLRRMIDCGGLKFILVNSIDELSVFQHTTLKWKASIINNPNVVDLRIGQFNGMKGFIVTLTDTGHLSVLYLGTDPSVNAVSIPSIRESISDNNEEQLAALQQKIRTITSEKSGAAAISIKAVDATKSMLRISIDYSSACLGWTTTTDGNNKINNREYSIDIKFKAQSDLRNVFVRVSVQKPIESQPKFHHRSSISPTDKESIFSLKFVSTAAMVVSSLRVALFISFEPAIDSLSGSAGISRIVQSSLSLPLGLVLDSCPPEKQAKFKLTLDSSESVVDLSQLFSDFAEPQKQVDEKVAAVAIGFRYHNDGPIVTILASANARRYRIQSDHFEAIYLVMRELSNRLNRYFKSNLDVLRFSESPPVDSYFLVLDCHFSIRSSLQQLEKLLEDRSRQFRAIQKLFLTKIKADPKSISSNVSDHLDSLESLLDNSITQLSQLAEIVIEQQHHLAIVGNALCSATALIGHLLHMSSSSSSSSSSSPWTLTQALSELWCRDFPELGFEELYEQIVAFLLRNLSQNAPNQSRIDTKVTDWKFELPSSIDRLKKHIRILCDRVGKGVQLSVGGDSNFDRIDPNFESNENDEKSETELKKFVTSPRSNKQKKSKKNKKLLIE